MAASQLPGLATSPRDLIRAAVLFGLQFYILPQSEWWMAGVWGAVWVATIVGYRRLGERVHDSAGLTILGMVLSVGLLLVPITILVLGLLARLRTA